MQWALVSTAPMAIWMWVLIPNASQDINGNPIQGHEWQQVNVTAGTIVNFIAYDGTSAYTPPANTKLWEVPITAKIGDTGY